jgi:Flp pilus assembly protein TadD
MVHETLAYLHAAEGKHALAIAAARKASDLAGDAETSTVLGYANARAGKRAEAQSTLTRLVELWRNGNGSAGRIAVVYAGLGNREQALAWLRRASQEHDVWMTLLKVDPVFDGLRSDERFKELLEKVRLH